MVPRAILPIPDALNATETSFCLPSRAKVKKRHPFFVVLWTFFGPC